MYDVWCMVHDIWCMMYDVSTTNPYNSEYFNALNQHLITHSNGLALPVLGVWLYVCMMYEVWCNDAWCMMHRCIIYDAWCRFSTPRPQHKHHQIFCHQFFQYSHCNQIFTICRVIAIHYACSGHTQTDGVLFTSFASAVTASQTVCMYDVWCMKDVWCMMCDVWCMKYDVWCMMYDVWCTNVWCSGDGTADYLLGLPFTSAAADRFFTVSRSLGVSDETLVYLNHTSHIIRPSYIIHHTSYIIHHTSYIIHPTH